MAAEQILPSHRPPWTDLPEAIRLEVAHRLGSAVVSHATRPGGFTSGIATVVESAAGSRHFIKALPLSDDQAASYRHEIHVNGLLPDSVPAPKLRFYVEDHGWLLLCFDNIDHGRLPGQPWTAHDLQVASALLQDLGRILTPSPSSHVRRIEDAFAADFFTWRVLNDSGRSGRLAAHHLGDLKRHLGALAALESQIAEAIRGDSLTHMDIRWDNIVLDQHSTAFAIDWAHPALAAIWVDTVGFVCSVEDPDFDREAFLASVFPEHAHFDNNIDTFLVALAGMWLQSSKEPELPGRDLRRQQARSANATLEWLRQRGHDLPELPKLGLA